MPALPADRENSMMNLDIIFPACHRQWLVVIQSWLADGFKIIIYQTGKSLLFSVTSRAGILLEKKVGYSRKRHLSLCRLEKSVFT